MYVPLNAVIRLILARWEKARLENPETPKPTGEDIMLEWYKMLDFYPKDATAFYRFRNQFPLEDQMEITFRLYTGPSYRVMEERARRRRR